MVLPHVRSDLSRYEISLLTVYGLADLASSEDSKWQSGHLIKMRPGAHQDLAAEAVCR